MRYRLALADLTLTNAFGILLVGNLADGLFTLAFLQLRMVEELNPLMRWLYELSPLSFMVAKLAMVQVGAVILCLQRQGTLARWVVNGGAALYGGIFFHHLSLAVHLV